MDAGYNLYSAESSVSNNEFYIVEHVKRVKDHHLERILITLKNTISKDIAAHGERTELEIKRTKRNIKQMKEREKRKTKAK